jgi:hypothetical protein
VHKQCPNGIILGVRSKGCDDSGWPNFGCKVAFRRIKIISWADRERNEYLVK